MIRQPLALSENERMDLHASGKEEKSKIVFFDGYSAFSGLYIF